MDGTGIHEGILKCLLMTPEARHTEILYGIHPVAEALSAGRRSVEQIFMEM